MTNELRPTLREDEGDWTFAYFVSNAPEGDGFVCAAEVQKRGEVRCKLISLRPELTRELVVDGMRERCLAWVRDWSTRTHSGDTGPAPLN